MDTAEQIVPGGHPNREADSPGDSGLSPSRHIFQEQYRHGVLPRTVGSQAVYDVLFSDMDRNWTARQVAAALGVEYTPRAVLDLSNRLGYLVSRGFAERIALGTYRAIHPQKGKPMTDTSGAETSENMCQECGYQAKSQMGLKAHQTRSHATISADEAFERTGKALEMLFPNGIPMSRIIELADLQKAMLRAITK